MTTLRETARDLIRIASELRDVAARVDGPSSAHFAAARDIRAVATNLDHCAAISERIGVAEREPDPDDIAWLANAAPGEVMEVFGR